MRLHPSVIRVSAVVLVSIALAGAGCLAMEVVARAAARLVDGRVSIADGAATGIPATPSPRALEVARIIRAGGAVVVTAVVILAAGASTLALWFYERRLMHATRDGAMAHADRARDLDRSRSAMIHGLVQLAEARDGAIAGHLERIRRYVRILAETLAVERPELGRRFIEVLVETSALHDIGKVGVPDEVLLRPGSLDAEQREAVERHVLIGLDTLLSVKRKWGEDPLLVTACEIVFAHHEHWDGTGYPFGLSGELIPLAARIVAVADVYDALTSPRVYKTAMSHEAARSILIEGRGRQFDPAVVDAFIESESRFRGVLAEFLAPAPRDGPPAPTA